MIAHLSAIKAALEARGWTCYLMDATGSPAWPYVVISPGYVPTDPDRPLSDVAASIAGDCRVTVVGVSAASTLGLAGAVRDALSPGGAWAPLAVSGRSAHLRWLRTEAAWVDRDITAPGSGSHPQFVVDTYALVSNPAPVP